jgi:MSHA pilin protein MshD
MSIKRRQAGLTLIELVMFMVIVGIAVASVLQVLAMSARSSPDPMRRKQALAIAEGMMEEVRLARFTFCDASDPKAEDPNVASPADCTAGSQEVIGPEAGNARPFDNVNDYIKTDGSAISYVTDATGNAFPVGYAATVAIAADQPLGPAGAQITSSATPANMKVLRITVTVTYDNTNSVVLDGYRTRYAPRSI